MASIYDPNKWEIYDPSIPNEEQPDSFITKRKLDKMEKGIRDASVELEIGTVTMGNPYNASIVEEETAQGRTRKLNITFPTAGKGEPGDDGKSAYEIWLDSGNIGTEQDFLDYLKGIDGKDGKDGKDGIDGGIGPKGDSAYQLWLNEGNIGTEEDFLNSLKGKQGYSTYELWLTIPGNEGKTLEEFLESLKGKPGDASDDIKWVDFGNATRRE